MTDTTYLIASLCIAWICVYGPQRKYAKEQAE